MSKFKVGDVIHPLGETTEFEVIISSASAYRLKELKTGVEFPSSVEYVDSVFRLGNHPDKLSLTNTHKSDDTKVMLEGIPKGYYLKSFRLVGPLDLIIKTNGKVCLGDEGYPGKCLFHPIIGKMAPEKSSILGIHAGYELVRIGEPEAGDHYIFRDGVVHLAVSKVGGWVYPIVRKIDDTPPCDGTLPGIPNGFKVLRFGEVRPDEFYYDSVGNLRQGPSNHRIALARIEDRVHYSGVDWAKGPDLSITRPADSIIDSLKGWVNDTNAVKFEHEYSVCGMAVYSQFKIGTLNATGKSRKVKVL